MASLHLPSGGAGKMQNTDAHVKLIDRMEKHVQVPACAPACNFRCPQSCQNICNSLRQKWGLLRQCALSHYSVRHGVPSCALRTTSDTEIHSLDLHWYCWTLASWLRWTKPGTRKSVEHDAWHRQLCRLKETSLNFQSRN